jgi:hypothetical protein
MSRRKGDSDSARTIIHLASSRKPGRGTRASSTPDAPDDFRARDAGGATRIGGGRDDAWTKVARSMRVAHDGVRG